MQLHFLIKWQFAKGVFLMVVQNIVPSFYSAGLFCFNKNNILQNFVIGNSIFSKLWLAVYCKPLIIAPFFVFDLFWEGFVLQSLVSNLFISP